MSEGSDRSFSVLLTAEEAFPALEREFMRAEQHIIAGFRIFDPRTKLRSRKALVVGDTWFDLIVATLNRGVSIDLIISDFDPVVRTSNHTYTWSCLRGVLAAAEASNAPRRLRVQAAMHPARVGLLPRLLLWPRLVKEIRENLADINDRSRPEKEHFLHEAPGLRPLIRWQGDSLVPRRFPPPPLVPVTHHQKLAVFDDARLYIGGLDLNDRRFDTPEHQQAASQTWHDVQVLVDGPVVHEAAAHLRSFQGIASGDQPQPTTHLLRTVSAKRQIALPFLSPRPVLSELAEFHRQQIGQSDTLIYLETQFFRDRNLARQLANRARENPALTLIIILPAAPEDAAFGDESGSDVAYGEYLQVKCIEIVRKAFGARVFIGSPAQPRSSDKDGRATHYGAPIVYLHAKISIFDDRCGIISSANLNGRSFAWDTEAGVTTQSASELAELKSRCYAQWLGPDADPACFNDKTALDGWAAQAARNTALRPEDRHGFLLPYSAGEAAALGYNLPGVPDEMV